MLEYARSPMALLCMVMRINLDCNACCRKMKKILLKMKEIERFLIDKQQKRVIVTGRFIPADVAIKMRKKMNRRVEILEIQELSYINGHVEQMQSHGPDNAIIQHEMSHAPDNAIAQHA